MSKNLRKTHMYDNQLDFFTSVFKDISIRDTQDTMEFPFLSLSKKPRFKPIEFENGKGKILVSAGEPFGLATIWDWDFMLWCISQLREHLDKGKSTKEWIEVDVYGYLKNTGKDTSETSYKNVFRTIERLKATTVKTSIRKEKGSESAMFSWISEALYADTKKGNLSSVKVKLPTWITQAVENDKLILTINKKYFLMNKGTEKWLYRFIRKQAGNNKFGWKWSFKTLHKRSGTTREYKYFARDLKEIIKGQELLDYTLIHEQEDKKDCLRAVKTKYRESDITPPFAQ